MNPFLLDLCTYVGFFAGVLFILVVGVRVAEPYHGRNEDYRKKHAPGFVNSRHQWIKTCVWGDSMGISENPKGVIFLCHGYGDYLHTQGFGSKSRGISKLAEVLEDAGYLVFGLEQHGCGRSEGIRCHTRQFSHYVDNIIEFVRIIQSTHPCLGRSPPPVFVLGQSMGGAIAIQVTRRWGKEFGQTLRLRGLLLVAPMCAIDKSLIPAWPVLHLLKLGAVLFPTAAVVPGDKEINKRSIKDPIIRERAANDPLEYNDRTRLSMGLELLNTTIDIKLNGGKEVHVPLLVCQGEDDIVCPAANSQDFVDSATSKDKKIVVFKGHWHGTLDEPGERGGKLVCKTILAWLEDHP
jgi:alpha-beta hydrolase superfamily lysophospholipase